jgi:hypothetical protein
VNRESPAQIPFTIHRLTPHLTPFSPTDYYADPAP